MQVVSFSADMQFQTVFENDPRRNCGHPDYTSTNLFDRVFDKSTYLRAKWFSKKNSINKKNRQGYTPLFVAIKNQSTHAVQAFLQKGADVTVCGRNGDSPLHLAVKSGNQDVVKMLLDYGANPDARSYPTQPSPVELAIYTGDCEMLSLLIHNRDVRKKPDLLYAAIKSRKFDMTRILLKAGVDPNIGTYSPLLHVSRSSSEDTVLEDYDFIALLVNYGADLFKRDEQYQTALHHVASRNQGQSHYEIIRYLLCKGAGPNACDSNGATPFHLALQDCDIELAKLFLKHGARPEIKNKWGRSAMHYACKQKNLEILHLLLDNGDSVHSTYDMYGMSVLYMFTNHENLESLRFLLKYGAHLDLNHADVSAVMPLLDILLNYKHISPVNTKEVDDIVRLFLICGTDVNALLFNYNDSLLSHVTTFKNDTWRTLVQHVAVLHETGKHVNPKILDEIMVCSKYREWYDKCLTELNLAKGTWVDNISVFDLLVGDVFKISNYCANEELKTKIESDWFSVNFPVYKLYIEEKYLMGLSNKKLRVNAHLALARMENPLPDLVIDKIVNYMNLSDLRRISRSAFPDIT